MLARKIKKHLRKQLQSKKLADGEKKDLGASIVRENEKAANDAIQEAVGLMQ